jgi:hypothetical protein
MRDDRSSQETVTMRLLAILAMSMLCQIAWVSHATAADTRSRISPSTIVLTGNLGPIGEGRRNFLKWNCYSCHGMNGAGGMGPNIQSKQFSDVKQGMTFGGVAGMISFVQIATNTDMQNIAAYLASIGTPNEPTWVDWWVANPTK